MTDHIRSEMINQDLVAIIKVEKDGDNFAWVGRNNEMVELERHTGFESRADALSDIAQKHPEYELDNVDLT